VLVLAAGVGVVHARTPEPVAAVGPAAVSVSVSEADEIAAARELRASAHRSTTTAAPTTTLPPTTTTAPPPPATTPPAPATTAAPRATATTAAPSAAPTPPPAAPAPDGPSYAMDLVRSIVPPRWLAALPVSVRVIGGKTSWSNWNGLIEISDWHLFHAVDRARNTLAHEWGHQVAWHYGTDAYEGAPPAGFPYRGRTPEEQWADCVAEVLTGTVYPSSGLGACPSDALAYTRAFLDAGPGPKLR
jgi:hypothetical protein